MECNILGRETMEARTGTGNIICTWNLIKWKQLFKIERYSIFSRLCLCHEGEKGGYKLHKRIASEI